MEELVETIQEDVAGLYFRSVLLPEGVMIPQHVHPYDHATLVASGVAQLFIDGEWAGDYRAGQAVEIKANRQHHFIALAADTRLVCVHHTASAVAAMEV
jgi:quercetin dioxygenase-like cupin family protein